MKYDKWPLEYRFKDLEPYIDRETVLKISEKYSKKKEEVK